MKKTHILPLLVCGLAALQFFFFSASLVSVASAQEPSPAPGTAPTAPSPATGAEPAPTPPGAPAPPTVPKPEEEKPEEEKPPPTLPGIPGGEEFLGLDAPSPTALPPAPGLVDTFQQRLALVPAGRLLFNLTVQEVYDDNAFNVAGDPEADFITSIVPSIALDRTRGRTSLRLQYTPRILRYVRFPENDRVDHTLLAAASWDPRPWIRVSLRDSLLITENVAEEADPLGIARDGLRRTTQNQLSPALELKLSPRNDLALRYTNTFIAEEGEDSRTTNSGSIAFGHRLRRGGVNFAYSVTSGDRSGGGDFVRHEGTLRTSWRLSRRDELLLLASGDFEDEGRADSTIVTAGVGLARQFSRRLQFRGIFGLQGLDELGGDSVPQFAFDSSLTWTFPRGGLEVGAEQGLQRTAGNISDVGVVLTSRVSGSLSYQVAPRLNLSVRGSFSRVERQEEDDRTDLIGRMGIGVRYRLGLVTLNAGYNFFDRNSDVEDNDLTRNRVFIGLSLGYDAPLPF